MIQQLCRRLISDAVGRYESHDWRGCGPRCLCHWQDEVSPDPWTNLNLSDTGIYGQGATAIGKALEVNVVLTDLK